MATITIDKKIKYKDLFKQQNIILKELEQLKAKLAIVASLRRFEDLSKEGRKFAKIKSIEPVDVLKND